MGFSADWLDLREPSDHGARDPDLLARAARCVGRGQVVLDLGCGTGSTARAFNGAFAGPMWRFVDADADMLAIAAARHPGSDQVRRNLTDIDALPLDGVGLVTASALLDLMPATWIEALARRLAEAGVPFYAALSYNGDMAWTPGLEGDHAITAAFNRHQLGDKGAGPAAGPKAAQITETVFRDHGFRVQSADSPWVLGPEQAALHRVLLAGIATAAQEAGAPGVAAWRQAREDGVTRDRVRIGHIDLLAMPPDRQAQS